MAHRNLYIVRPANHLAEPLEHDEAGTLQTLRRMGELVRESITDRRQLMVLRQLATQLTAGLPGQDHERKADRIFLFCRDRIKFQRDPLLGDYVASPLQVLADKQDDCDGKVVLACALLASIGLVSRFEALAEDVKWNHVFYSVELPGKRKFYDPTPAGAPAGWRGRATRYMSYGIFGAEQDQIAGFWSVLGKVAGVAAMAIPGIGPAIGIPVLTAGAIGAAAGAASSGIGAALQAGASKRERENAFHNGAAQLTAAIRDLAQRAQAGDPQVDPAKIGDQAQAAVDAFYQWAGQLGLSQEWVAGHRKETDQLLSWARQVGAAEVQRRAQGQPVASITGQLQSFADSPYFWPAVIGGGLALLLILRR